MLLFHRVNCAAALRAARDAAGREICGLLVYNGHFISLVPTRNVARRNGRFILSAIDARRIAKAAQTLGYAVVGAFHSHPCAPIRPSAGDIRHAPGNSLMMILDCSGNRGSLWKIEGRRAFPRRFRFL